MGGVEVAEVQVLPLSNLAVRILVGGALATAAGVASQMGGWVFAGFVALATVVAFNEWIYLRSIVGRGRTWAFIVLLAALGYALCIDPIHLVPNRQWMLLLIVPAAVQFMLTPKYVAAWDIFGRSEQALQVAKSITQGLFIVATPAIALLILRQGADGLLWVFFTFAIVWSADIAAYAVGRTVGGPKLWPAISPNKTWAGFVGACVAACGAAVAVAPYVHVAPVRAAIAGLLLGALAQGGDLFESALKRRAGVKDSGTLLPGHGGVLDRLDSLIPVAPAVAGAVALGWL